ncbi:MAG TPA: DUF6597 domain-containing transcriptional factor [Rhizomicrobium sp.]|jgi:AraC-like DNA-binding protein|nr:DUF6597 domain-containing transcriptional factor [Rhizomicrobium sp.]
MIYETYVPPPPLNAFIANFWHWEGDNPGHAKDTVMASSRLAILINLKEDALDWYGGKDFADNNRLKGMALCGMHTAAFAINAYQPYMMGVDFKPGGAAPFFRAPMGEFQNNHVSLQDIWGPDAERLHQRLIQAPSPRDRFAILQQALLGAAPRDIDFHPAVAAAMTRLASGRVCRVAALAAQAEISHKRFIRLFMDEVGVTPKLYLRMTRFQNLLDRVWNAPSVDWAEAAARHGYFDQPHLIREFREFSGFTPAQYMTMRGPYTNHVPLTG